MIDSELSIAVRNILLLHLLAVAPAREASLALRTNLLKIWKALTPPRPPRAGHGINKARPGFFEIDMTRFEP